MRVLLIRARRIAVQVIVSLEPLHHLEVVQGFCLDEPLNVDVLRVMKVQGGEFVKFEIAQERERERERERENLFRAAVWGATRLNSS